MAAAAAAACAAVIVAAAQAVAAVVRASPKRRRYSGHTFGNAILHWYGTTGSMPRGISVNCASVRDWALRNGVALRKLVAILNGFSGLLAYGELTHM